MVSLQSCGMYYICCTDFIVEDLASGDHVSEESGKSSDLLVVTHKKQHRGKNDEELNQQQPSVVVNGNGVCHYVVLRHD